MEEECKNRLFIFYINTRVCKSCCKCGVLLNKVFASWDYAHVYYLYGQTMFQALYCSIYCSINVCIMHEQNA